MNTRPSLVRSIPFWILLVGSLASVGFGLWLMSDKLSVMISTLTDQSATGVEVYAGQSWIVVAAAFIGAGLVGLVAVLALAVARSFVSRPVEVVEAIAWEEAPADEVLPTEETATVADPTTTDAEEKTGDDAEEKTGVDADENVPAQPVVR